MDESFFHAIFVSMSVVSDFSHLVKKKKEIFIFSNDLLDKAAIDRYGFLEGQLNFIVI